MRALLLEPYPGKRWLSITRYAREITDSAGLASLEVERAHAPWWNPPSIAEGIRRRWTSQHALAHAADVVHLADHALGHHVPRFRPSPVVVTCHDIMPLVLPGYYRSPLESAVKRAFMRKALAGMQQADRIICISDRTASDIESRFGVDRSRITVVPNVVDSTFAPIPGARTWLSARGIRLPERPLILSVGHAGPYKNLDTLLVALASPQLQGAVLIRAGSRFAPARAGRATELGVASRVVELGHVSDAVLRHLYAACDVLAQPSLFEGFGVPVIEAMATGLPVVCSDGGALPEVAGKGALVVPCASRSATAAGVLSDALASVLNDERERAELRERGLERAQYFRPPRVMPLLREAYEQAVVASRRPRPLGRTGESP
jgi:glycosyltransferase involved in cell wall biosynthesis